MSSNLPCLYRNKSGDVIKSFTCSLDNTIGYLIDYSFQTEEKYCLAEISDPELPNLIVSIVGAGESQYRLTTRTHQFLEVYFDIKLEIDTHSDKTNLEADYQQYLEENKSSFESILAVGGLLDIKIEHVGHTLTCYFPYEMYEEPYHYMVDVYSLIELGKEIQKVMLNFKKN